MDNSVSHILDFFSAIDEIDTQNTDDLPRYSIDSRNSRKVYVIKSRDELDAAILNIQGQQLIGLDTEQKPVFRKGDPQNRNALIQMATASECYLFQTNLIGNIKPILNILEDEQIVKVGFDLKSDKKHFSNESDTNIKSCIDLTAFFQTELQSGKQVGAKKAVALLLQQKMEKSKRMSLSNWEKNNLSGHQIKYAAEDATAAYDVLCSLLEKYPFVMGLLPKWFQIKFNFKN